MRFCEARFSGRCSVARIIDVRAGGGVFKRLVGQRTLQSLKFPPPFIIFNFVKYGFFSNEFRHPIRRSL